MATSQLFDTIINATLLSIAILPIFTIPWTTTFQLFNTTYKTFTIPKSRNIHSRSVKGTRLVKWTLTWTNICKTIRSVRRNISQPIVSIWPFLLRLTFQRVLRRPSGQTAIKASSLFVVRVDFPAESFLIIFPGDEHVPAKGDYPFRGRYNTTRAPAACLRSGRMAREEITAR